MRVAKSVRVACGAGGLAHTPARLLYQGIPALQPALIPARVETRCSRKDPTPVVAPLGGLRAPRATARTEAWNLSTTAEGYSARGVVPGLEWAAAELRWPSQVQNWIEPRCAVDRVAGRRVIVSRPCWAALTARKGGPPPAPLLVENLLRPPPAGKLQRGAMSVPRAFTDASRSLPAGQFACSDRHVFYRPREPYGGPPRDAWAPLHEAILQAEGLANHSFQRLAFSHATWRQPSTQEGYLTCLPSGATSKWNVSGVEFY